MRNLTLRIIALLAAALMLASAFVACDTEKAENNNPEQTDAPQNETDEAAPAVKKTDYDDEFYLSVMTHVNPMDIFWVEESAGDAMSEAVYARQQKVQDYLGVEIKAKSAGGFPGYVDEFKTAVQNKDGSVDTLLTHVSKGIAGFISENYIQDFQDIPGIDLDMPYWNREFMDANAIGDAYYLGFSDFNILYTYVIAFNKKMLNQLALDGYGVDEMYERVYSGNWTLDAFLDLAQKGFQNKGSEDKHIYGLVGQQWVPWCGFFHSSGINLIEINEKGQYELSFYNDENREKTANLVDKLKNFSASGYAELVYGTNRPNARLSNNRALMEIEMTYGLDNLLDSDISFGVLPYPLYDTAQYDGESESLGYRSLQWGGQIAIPNYLENAQMVGETLEMLSYYSAPVQVTFYEKVLGKQVSEAPDDARMLEIVWNGICTDVGQTFDDMSGVLYFLPKVTWPGQGGYDLTSHYASVEKSSAKKINKFFEAVIKKQNAQ